MQDNGLGLDPAEPDATLGAPGLVGSVLISQLNFLFSPNQLIRCDLV